MIHLKELIQEFIKFDLNPQQNQMVTGLTLDSRLVEWGNVFFACLGTKQDGSVFIDEAISRGAIAILIECKTVPNIPFTLKNNVPIIFIKDLSLHAGEIAARFYKYPAKSLQIIGITGTNGKTSCCHFIANALNALGCSCGIIGTLGYGAGGHLQHLVNTTPDPITLQKLLAEFREQNFLYVVMEVSSHGIVKRRIAGIEFAIGVFTNLTRDHLDFHGDMEHYAQAKHDFFTTSAMKYALLNADDAYGLQWLNELNKEMSVFAYSSNPQIHLHSIPTIAVHHAQFDHTGITASLHTPWGDGVLHNANMIGRFNLSNLLAVVATLGILEFPLQDTLAQIANLRGVPGRMEVFGGGDKPLVIVDYAHTPDALEQVLKVLREYEPGKLWCVFGCGGDRDPGKRPLMGETVEKYADHVIITDDNPRNEDPKQIVADILTGLKMPEKAIVEHDRRRAIAHVIECARPNEIVLIAGKGHETYQIIGSNTEPFSDAIEVQVLLAQNYNGSR